MKNKTLKVMLYLSVLTLFGVIAYIIPHNTDVLRADNQKLTTEIEETEKLIVVQKDYNQSHSESLSDQQTPTRIFTEFLRTTFDAIEKNSQTIDTTQSGTEASVGAAKLTFGGHPGMKVKLDALDMMFNESKSGNVYGYGTVVTTTDSRGLDMGHGKVTQEPESRETKVIVTMSLNDKSEYIVSDFQAGEIVKGENTDEKIR